MILSCKELINVSNLPIWVDFTTKEHESLAIDKERLFIPSDLYNECTCQYKASKPKNPNQTYIFLK